MSPQRASPPTLLRLSERQLQKKDLPTTSSLSKYCNSQVRARLKPGARISIQVCHTGGKSPSTWVILSCFARHMSRKLDRKRGSPDYASCKPSQPTAPQQPPGRVLTAISNRLLLNSCSPSHWHPKPRFVTTKWQKQDLVALSEPPRQCVQSRLLPSENPLAKGDNQGSPTLEELGNQGCGSGPQDPPATKTDSREEKGEVNRPLQDFPNISSRLRQNRNAALCIK